MADHRLIEDYIPIKAISAEARREKSIHKGHISTLYLGERGSPHPQRAGWGDAEGGGGTVAVV